MRTIPQGRPGQFFCWFRCGCFLLPCLWPPWISVLFNAGLRRRQTFTKVLSRSQGSLARRVDLWGQGPETGRKPRCTCLRYTSSSQKHSSPRTSRLRFSFDSWREPLPWILESTTSHLCTCMYCKYAHILCQVQAEVPMSPGQMVCFWRHVGLFDGGTLSASYKCWSAVVIVMLQLLNRFGTCRVLGQLVVSWW